MMAQRRSILPALLLLAAAGGGIVWGITAMDRPAHPPVSTQQPSALSADQPGICVTDYGLCGAMAARTGDPCACPHPLRGFVPGYIERLGAEAGPALRSPPSDTYRDDRSDWEKLEGVSPR